MILEEKRFQDMICIKPAKDTKIERYFIEELEPIKYYWDCCWSALFFSTFVQFVWGNCIHGNTVSISIKASLC